MHTFPNSIWIATLLVLLAIAGCSKSNHDKNPFETGNGKGAGTEHIAMQKTQPLRQSANHQPELVKTSSEGLKSSGLMFTCRPEQVGQIQRDMEIYFRELGVESDLIKRTEPVDGKVIYTLATPESDTDTLSFKNRKQYHIKNEIVILPARGARTQAVQTVSKKEILLSLLQHGRLTEFSGAACSVEALRDHVGVRQNIIAWIEKVSWQWPDGGPAFWNKKYWDKGTPLASVNLDNALLDSFINQKQYGIGCYTASKLSYAHGVLDYYTRVKKDKVKAVLVRERLLQDKDPLVGIEASAMWSFDRDFNPEEGNIPGKILTIKRGIASNNFIPGDWAYLLNTDAMTYEKLGYEGSNAVYLGRGRFDDYFNDNNHHYTYREKVDEVYQWRNGVFSRSRDFKKIKPLSDEDFVRLSKTPQEGGLLEDFRVVPYFFGYQDLPELPTR
jgi:hypothetical protein